MLLTVEEHAPQSRCYICGTPNLFSLCHHCGKGICRQHSSKAVDALHRPVSREFADLGLADRQASTYHCVEHDHVVKGGLRAFIWTGAVITLAGVGIVFAAIIAGLIILAAGAVIMSGAYLAHRRRKVSELSVRPPLPVLPSLNSVSVREKIRGHVSLDEDRNYTSTPEATNGTAEIVMTLAQSDRDRLHTYRTKYSLAPGDPVDFSAGFALLKGEAGLAFKPGPELEALLLPGETSLAFHGTVTGHPLFSTTPGQPAGRWKIRLPYNLQGSREPHSIPIWIVPSLIPSSDMRALVLDLRWDWSALEEDRPWGERRLLTFRRFEFIELTVPKSWGNVESVTPSAFISNPDTETVRTIEWKQLSPDEQDDDEEEPDRRDERDGEAAPADAAQMKDSPEPGRPPQRDRPPQADDWAEDEDDSEEDELAEPDSLMAADGRAHAADQAEREKQAATGSQPLTIRFEKRIRSSDKISGRLRASFRGTLAGVTDIRMYRPAGRRWLLPPKSTIELEATVDFELSLGSIRYQDVQVVPHRNALKVDTYLGVIPDFETVMELTDELSDAGYYVKRVIENPPRAAGRTDMVNRYWDIAGRRYDGVFPIDFHIALTGEEQHGSGIRAKAGNTRSQLIVHGSYANAAMKAKIENEWGKLHGIVGATLKRQEKFAPEDTDGWGDSAGSGPTAEVPVTPGAERPEPGRATMLRKRLEAATDALIAGQISEEVYRGIEAAIQAELDGMSGQ